MAIENATGVSIDHEYRMISRVQKNGVRRLRAHTVQRKQFFAEFVRGLCEEIIQRAAVFASRNATKVLSRFAFWRK